MIGSISVEEYESTRPPRRTHFEMVLPRKVRQDMLKREWDISNQQIANAVRVNVKVKNQRKATVNNLGKATKIEEAFESAGRKIRRALLFQKPVSKQVRELEEKVNEANRKRSQLKLELNMAGEYCDGSYHSVGSIDDIPEATPGRDTPEATPEAIGIQCQ